MARVPASRADEIATRVYELAKAQGYSLRGLYPSVLKRVKELCEATKDPDQVELVALASLGLDGEDFVAWSSLAWNRFEFLRDQLDVPKGGWRYALFLELLDAGELRDSADYWYARWRDAAAVGDYSTVAHAKKMLDKLMEAR